jgi:predicted nuclease with RNAse H fold
MKTFLVAFLFAATAFAADVPVVEVHPADADIASLVDEARGQTDRLLYELVFPRLNELRKEIEVLKAANAQLQQERDAAIAAQAAIRAAVIAEMQGKLNEMGPTP